MLNANFSGIHSDYNIIKSHYDFLSTETFPCLERKYKQRKCKIRLKGI